MARVVHFEIGADDPERAVKFYKDAFGWGIQKWEGPEPYYLATTGTDGEPGINGAIQPRQGESKVVNTIDVPDLDAYIEKVQGAGASSSCPSRKSPRSDGSATARTPKVTSSG